MLHNKGDRCAEKPLQTDKIEDSLLQDRRKS
jgi:hypothetical protein